MLQDRVRERSPVVYTFNDFKEANMLQLLEIISSLIWEPELKQEFLKDISSPMLSCYDQNTIA